MRDSTHTSLYRLFAEDGALLYVGIAGNPGRRFEQHRSDKPWWGHVALTTVEHYRSRESAMVAELAAIRSEHPRHNIMGAGSRNCSAVRRSPQPGDPTQPYPIGTEWEWTSLRSGFGKKGPLELFWELDCSSITDNYSPFEATAYQMWDHWMRRLDGAGDGVFDRALGRPWVPIFWLVVDAFEAAPFQHDPLLPEDWLSFYSWPHHSITRERLNWNRLPVQNLHWTPDQQDKGGFIQEATGWKPSPLQPYVNVDMLSAACGLRSFR